MHGPIAVLGDIDVAFLCVVAFVAFFIGLVYYLRQEDKREGFPMVQIHGGRHVEIVTREGWPELPAPKTFRLPHGHGTVTVPRRDAPEIPDDVEGRVMIGEGLRTDGNPLDIGLGAAAYQADKPDFPDLNYRGEPKIVSLDRTPDFYILPGDPDPRGWPFLDKHGRRVGTITDLWFNKAEYFLRYFTYRVDDTGEELIAPSFFCIVDIRDRTVRARTLIGEDLLRAPVKAGEVITWVEEDRVNGYFAGGIPFAPEDTAGHPREVRRP